MAVAARKERKTFSLDPELMKYIDMVKKKNRIQSASSALEEILRENKQRHDEQQLDDRIASYYSSLTEEEVRQEEEWGKFSEAQIPTE